MKVVGKRPMVCGPDADPVVHIMADLSTTHCGRRPASQGHWRPAYKGDRNLHRCKACVQAEIALQKAERKILRAMARIGLG